MQRLIWSEMSGKDKLKLIIEDVLHYRWFDSDESYYEELRAKGGVKLPICICGYIYMFESGADGKLFDGKLFNPLVDMNDAWKLLVLMPANAAELKYFRNSRNNGKYFCNIMDRDGKKHSINAKTPQDAICRAVLSACGIVLD